MPDESFCDETGWGGILLSTPVAACRRKRTFGVFAPVLTPPYSEPCFRNN
ncbi:hypothetical protein AGABI1DRAFT_135187 [Agaricus bisporus var. burnettii JB137-S8]|uniref:Uncharacterized protein n=1 Tax=Agaricus bisporus var. burnettii (strain JB137-S8 / ATCC MYA-4627 / FGSC 10392) TaxID=597362 RepID=K5WDF4_AGABU|nr:uncharacterized protein AGABI1DRAFT_135187 [Agaricus bisporus var. burnettii JB137-S8]EKM73271.1 hypothetical protein AGABI1DRAFT_135187 [Agaricus bisporus var. burnettii JB137-S8]